MGLPSHRRRPSPSRPAPMSGAARPPGRQPATAIARSTCAPEGALASSRRWRAKRPAPATSATLRGPCLLRGPAHARRAARLHGRPTLCRDTAGRARLRRPGAGARPQRGWPAACAPGDGQHRHGRRLCRQADRRPPPHDRDDTVPGAAPRAEGSDPGLARTTLRGFQQLVRACCRCARVPATGSTSLEPLVPGQPVTLEFELPDIHHAFRRGHQLMVQVQSSWFPLMDRNPALRQVDGGRWRTFSRPPRPSSIRRGRPRPSASRGR